MTEAGPEPGYDTVEVGQDGPVLSVRLNRPQAMNAFNADMGRELKHVFEVVLPSSDARVLVLRGAGDNFMAGADLGLLEHWMSLDEDELNRTFADGFDAGALAAVDVPVVCAVDGIAFGLGFDLALAADYVIASDRALFGLPESNVGVVPMGASTYHLQRRVGAGRALRVQMLGENVAAAQALEWGLVAKVVPPEELDAAVAKAAGRFAARSRSAMAATKRLIRDQSAEAVRAAVTAERAAMIAMLRSADVVEGVAAVREKRRPSFS